MTKEKGKNGYLNKVLHESQKQEKENQTYPKQFRDSQSSYISKRTSKTGTEFIRNNVTSTVDDRPKMKSKPMITGKSNSEMEDYARAV